jgi:putative holliday junction resolvase
MIPQENRVLAIDFGLKRIGIALSDPLKIFAYPFKTFSNDSNFFTDLLKLIKEQNVVKIILGIPDADNKSTNDLKQKINTLKDRIEKTGIEIITWDESYTSLIASERILESVSKKNKRKEKGLLDQHSAAIILQEYLDSVKNSEKKK